MRWFVVLLLIAVVGAAVQVLRPTASPRSDGAQKPLLVATISPLADWLREVGGPAVEVHCLVSGGSNPHHFEPAIRDAAVVARARALFAVGLGLDEWARRLAANSGRGAELAFFETGPWIKPWPFNFGTAPAPGGVTVASAHGHGQFDPHYWLDPGRACEVVTRMAGELGQLDPPHSAGYRQRAAAYVEKLKALDNDLASRARAVPPGAQIVTFHDAYGYLLERLGIRLAAVIESSPGVEPSARDVSEALRIMKQLKQRAVFQEPEETSTAAQTIAKELGIGLEVLDPLDTEASSVGKTYVERVRHDIEALAEAVKK